MDKYKSIKENPPKDGIYFVKFYSKYMPEYDCVEFASREFKNGEWIKPFYNYEGDGYEPIAWCE